MQGEVGVENGEQAGFGDRNIGTLKNLRQWRENLKEVEHSGEQGGQLKTLLDYLSSLG